MPTRKSPVKAASPNLAVPGQVLAQVARGTGEAPEIAVAFGLPRVRTPVRCSCGPIAIPSLLLLFSLLVGPVGALDGAAGPNLALGRPVSVNPLPEYPLTGNNPKSLTDGMPVSPDERGYFWERSGCVGWIHWDQNPWQIWDSWVPILVTIDLGESQPIGGLSYSTAGNSWSPVAGGAPWPSSILVFTSEDLSTWRYAGDLILLSLKKGLPPFGGDCMTFQFQTDELKSRGRYIRLCVLTRGAFTFCDEVEVYGGSADLQATGPAVTDFGSYLAETRLQRAIADRLRVDVVAAKQAVDASTSVSSRKAQLQTRLDAVLAAIPTLPVVDRTTFQAVLPFNTEQARIYSVYGDLLHDKGSAPLILWKKHRYAPLSPTEMPATPVVASAQSGGTASAPVAATDSVTIRMLQNEFRSDAFLITNATDGPVNAAIQVKSTPALKPGSLAVSVMPWTDTGAGVPIAAAIPLGAATNGIYPVSIPSGMTRKIWLTVDSTGLAPGNYIGTLDIVAGAKSYTYPFIVTVSGIQMKRPRLSLGMWDFSDQSTCYDLTPKNKANVIELQQSHFVDSPWATCAALPWPNDSDFAANNTLKGPLTFAVFDAWVKLWPNARRYMVFAYVDRDSTVSFAGAAIGTPAFKARVGAWAKALADHMRTLGLAPSQLCLSLVDEPLNSTAAQIAVAWADAIKATAPELSLFQDSIWGRPDQISEERVFSLPDWLSPNLDIFYQGGAEVRNFWEGLRAKGHRLWFYRCAEKSNDPQNSQRLMAWHAFQQKAEGIGLWSICDNGGGDDWNQYGTRGTSYSPVFLSPNGATNGIHWEAVREGVEDHEYFSMLQDAVAQPEGAAFRAAAQALFAQLEAALTASPRMNQAWAVSSGDHEVLDTLRLQALDLLERIAAAAVPKPEVPRILGIDASVTR